MILRSSQQILGAVFCLLAFGGAFLIQLGWVTNPLQHATTSATFRKQVIIGPTEWAEKAVNTTCMLVSTKQVYILGVETPCPCVTTHELPMKVEASGETVIHFTVDLSGFVGSQKGEPIRMPVKFLTQNYRDNVVAQLTLVPQLDLTTEENE